jgi:two-component system, LytTR family, response regulator
MTTPRLRVLIVDDDAVARRRLRQLLHDAPDFDVVGECSDAREVAAMVRALRPAVLFLDIRMPHLDGFEVRETIRHSVRHIIFVTAHAEHAARAFDVAASDYLVKPVTQSRFVAALDRVRRAHGEPAATAGGAGRILLGGRQGGAAVSLTDVTWVAADGAYVVVHAGGRKHVLRESLAQILDRLGETSFVRIHRSAGINLAHVRAVRRGRKGLEVELSDGTRLPISRRKARDVVDLLRREGDEAPGRAKGGAARNTAGPLVR